MRILAIAALLALAACAADTGDEADDDVDSTGEELSSPSSFNPGHMHHVEVCAKLASDVVKLRFADGTPNGFELDKSKLVFGADAAACKKQVEALGDRAAADAIAKGKPSGYVMLDVHELADGGRMAFHRGGFGYTDGRVKYGFVRLSDLVARDADRARQHRKDLDGPFGKACTKFVKAYKVVVEDVPAVMQFRKSNDPVDTNSWQSYGDPSSQGGLVAAKKYTYVNWTWPAEPGGTPNPGGGMVRTILPDGATFERCDVKAIRSPTYAENTRTPNGEIVAIYGRYRAGGESFFGWVPYSHTYNGAKVMHVR